MARFLNDPLLSVTKTLLRFAYRFCLAFAVLVVILGPLALLFAHDPSPYSHMTPMQYRATAISLFLSGPLLALYGWFLRILWQMVDTVAGGSPFLAVNADRLTRMAWLALLLQVVSVIETLLVTSDAISPLVSQRGWGSLLLALTLFVLARVFRQGTAMREDLEGTV